MTPVLNVHPSNRDGRNIGLSSKILGPGIIQRYLSRRFGQYYASHKALYSRSIRLCIETNQCMPVSHSQTSIEESMIADDSRFKVNRVLI